MDTKLESMLSVLLHFYLQLPLECAVVKWILPRIEDLEAPPVTVERNLTQSLRNLLDQRLRMWKPRKNLDIKDLRIF